MLSAEKPNISWSVLELGTQKILWTDSELILNLIVCLWCHNI